MTLPQTVRELNAQFGIALDATSLIQTQRSEYERELQNVQPIAEVVELAPEAPAGTRIVAAATRERGGD